ncbi:hypothetical protein ABEB36_004073 [Hypothenemus hampei]|uniref:Uncharacterized protein n=1 Tax=Hypothenemus hampei TaxID=57062 RepID=A0ABD1F244_HYPHA
MSSLQDILKDHLDLNEVERQCKPIFDGIESSMNALYEEARRVQKVFLAIKKTGRTHMIDKDFDKLGFCRFTEKIKEKHVKLVTSNEWDTNGSKNGLLTEKRSIKIEKEDMPAPAWIPPIKKPIKIKVERASTKRTRSTASFQNARDSDVIFQKPSVPVISLSDTEDSDLENREKNPNPITRVTRSKAQKIFKQQKDGNTEDVTNSSNARSTRTRTKNKNTESSEVESNINEAQLKASNATFEVRTTRTRTIKKHTTAEESKNDEKTQQTNPEVRITRTELTKETIDTEKDQVSNIPSSCPESVEESANSTTQTIYQDAQASPQPTISTTMPLNTTVTIQPKSQTALNANDVKAAQQPPISLNIFENSSNNELFTDDESLDEKGKTTSKNPITTTKVGKEIFSPYVKTTLQKKVEAFESLEKTKIISQNLGAKPKRLPGQSSAVKEKATLLQSLTPLGKSHPKACSTTKVSRLLSQNLQNLSSNNQSLLKSNLKDPVEKYKKQKEREQALKKKEALLQERTEKRRKLNEEKQLKAQQQRQALEEAEKQRLVEIQKQLDEKYMRQLELKKQEKLKQEQEKKRQEQKDRLRELQRKEENMPIYMTTKAPRLPTDDYYDSDDPDYDTHKITYPRWCEREQLRTMELLVLSAGQRLKNTVFLLHAQTPDLQQIFEHISPEKLKRTSSAVWKKPPRYTHMPDLDETRFSDDDNK